MFFKTCKVHTFPTLLSSAFRLAPQRMEELFAPFFSLVQDNRVFDSVCVCVCDHLIDTDSLIKRGWPSLRNGPVELVHKKPICALKHGLAFSTTPPPPHTHTQWHPRYHAVCVSVCMWRAQIYLCVTSAESIVGSFVPFFFFLKNANTINGLIPHVGLTHQDRFLTIHLCHLCKL